MIIYVKCYIQYVVIIVILVYHVSFTNSYVTDNKFTIRIPIILSQV